MNLKRTSEEKWMVFVFLAGIALRFYGLGAKPFYEDEGYTLDRVLHFTFHQLAFNIFDISNMPFYFILVKGIGHCLGVQEFSIRLLSAVAGSLSVGLMYPIGKICKSAQIGLLAAALLAVSPLSILWAQTARPYGLLSFFTVLSFFCFLRYLREKKILYFCLFSLTSLLGLATHVLFAIPLFGNFLFLLLFMKKMERREIWKWLAGMGILLAAFWIVLGHHYWAAHRLVHLPPQGIGSISFRIFIALFSLAVGETIYPLNWGVVIPAALLFGTASVAALYHCWLRREKWDIFILLHLFLVFAAWTYLDTNGLRYLAFAAPIFCLLIALGLDSLPSLWRIAGIVGICCVSFVSACFWFSGNPYQVMEANFLIPWNQIVQDIQHQWKPGEIILVHQNFPSSILDYYSPPEIRSRLIFLPEKDYKEKLNEILDGRPQTLWLLRGPLASRENKIPREAFYCYQERDYRKYVDSPILSEQLATGKMRMAPTVEWSYFQRGNSCPQ